MRSLPTCLARRAPSLLPNLDASSLHSIPLSRSDTLLHCIGACTSPFKPCCVAENKAFWACYKGARGLGDLTSLSGVLGKKKRDGAAGEEETGEGGGKEAT